MSDRCAMLEAYQLPQGVPMDEFYTAETYYAMQMAEFEAEQEWEQAMEKLAPFDPYEYEDEELQDPYDGREDIGMEAGLFGWDA